MTDITQLLFPLIPLPDFMHKVCKKGEEDQCMFMARLGNDFVCTKNMPEGKVIVKEMEFLKNRVKLPSPQKINCGGYP